MTLALLVVCCLNLLGVGVFALLYLHERGVASVLRAVSRGEKVVVGVRKREDATLGVAVHEGGMYHFTTHVADQLIERGWVKPL